MNTELPVVENKNPRINEQDHQIDPLAEARDYVAKIREHYQAGDFNYNGQRNDDQVMVAELVADQAREMVDGAAAGFIAMGAALGGNPNGPQDFSEIVKQHENDELAGGFTWSDYRETFASVLSATAIVSKRLQDNEHPVKDYMDLTQEEQMKVASVLFSDFQEHNGLRFGVDTTGLEKSKTEMVHNFDEGTVEPQITVTDPDKAYTKTELERNMRRRGYKVGRSQHQAAKMSPDQYRELRAQYPDVEKDDFDHVISSSRHADETLQRHKEKGEELVGAQIAASIADAED